jgi:hypothetical protein
MTTTRAPTDTEIRAPRDLDSPPEDADSGDRTWAERHTEAGRPAEGDRPGAAAAAVGTAIRGLTRLVRLAAGIIAAVIALGIAFVVLEANPDNAIVSAVDDVARALVGPFDGMFELDNAKTEVAVNWGIAAFAYLILGALVAWLIGLIGMAGRRSRRT